MRPVLKHFVLSERLSVVITKLTSGNLFCRWDPPSPPDRLTKEELAAYLAARKEMEAS